MAWISVYEHVLGGKLRALSKEIGCSQNEALGLLVRFWLWGISNADREGRITGATEEDVAEALRIGTDPRYQPQAMIEAMVETGWIDADGEGIFIHDWEDWQTEYYKKMDTRARDRERKRKKPSQGSDPGAQASVEKQEAPLPVPKNNFQPEPKQKSVYPDSFEDFWKAYPRKVDKGNAYKKYMARLNSGWSADQLLEAAKNYAAECSRNHTEQSYIKHAATFLSDATPFVDYLKGQKDGGGKPVDNDDPYADWR